MIRVGKPPYLECSTKGDKRFSSFCSKIKSRGNKSIEEIYQGFKIFEGGVTGLTWKEAKGKCSINIVEAAKLYSVLWDEYITENIDFLDILKKASGLSDIFGQVGKQCQVLELWRIRNEW